MFFLLKAIFWCSDVIDCDLSAAEDSGDPCQWSTGKSDRHCHSDCSFDWLQWQHACLCFGDMARLHFRKCCWWHTSCYSDCKWELSLTCAVHLPLFYWCDLIGSNMDQGCVSVCPCSSQFCHEKTGTLDIFLQISQLMWMKYGMLTELVNMLKLILHYSIWLIFKGENWSAVNDREWQ